MKLKNVHSDKNTATFIVTETTPAYMNALRRFLVSKVPTMAIEDVKFVENGSALYDEMLAHRMGLVPFHTDLKSYFIKEKCKCKGAGCARCQVSMSVNKTGPCIVYAENIKCKDPKITPVYPKMPVVKLFEGQTVKAEMTACLGYGKDHIKFSPGVMFFQGYPIFKISEAKNAKEIADLCPKKILKVDGKKLKVTDESKCDLCRACRDANPDAIRVDGSEEDFIVNVESWGQLPVKQMLATALEEFDSSLDELDEELKDIKQEK